LRLFDSSAFFERAAVTEGGDLRGLGKCHQQAFLRGQASGPTRKIRKLVQVCIACRLKKLIILEFLFDRKSRKPSGEHDG